MKEDQKNCYLILALHRNFRWFTLNEPGCMNCTLFGIAGFLLYSLNHQNKFTMQVMVWNKYCILGIVFPILLFAFIIDKVLGNTHEQILLDHIYFLLLWAIVVLFVRKLSNTGGSFQARFTFFSKTCQKLLDLCNGTSRIQTLEKKEV